MSNLRVIKYINDNLSLDEEWYRVFGTTIPEGKIFCPFHQNVNTPSAKRYGNGIKCFGYCQHYYTLYEFLKKFNPDRIEEIKKTVILPEVQQKNDSHIIIVKQGELSLKQYLDVICEVNSI